MVNISFCNKGGFFNRKGFSLTDRRNLFYGGCVTIRAAIVLLVYFFMVSDQIPILRLTKEDMKKSHIVIPSLLLIFSALSVVHGLSCLRAGDKVWWSRKFAIVVAILLICLSGYVLYEIVERDRGEGSARVRGADAKRRSDYALMLSLPIAIQLILGILLSFTVYFS